MKCSRRQAVKALASGMLAAGLGPGLNQALAQTAPATQPGGGGRGRGADGAFLPDGQRRAT